MPRPVRRASRRLIQLIVTTTLALCTIHCGDATPPPQGWGGPSSPSGSDDSSGGSGGGRSISGDPNRGPSSPSSPSGADPDTPPPPPPPSSTGTGTPPPPPPPPAANEPFRRLDVRNVLGDAQFIVQCESPTSQRVWQTSAPGPDVVSVWGIGKYKQSPSVPNLSPGCGSMTGGHYPIVFTTYASGALPSGMFVAKCVDANTAEVYKITGSVDGHPSASFQYPETHPTCANSLQ